jgi:hypothetical protein
MQEAILSAIVQRYLVDHKLQATEAEIAAYIQDFDLTIREDRERREKRLVALDQNLRSTELSVEQRAALITERLSLQQEIAALQPEVAESPEEREEILQARRSAAKAFIERWKFNRALYRQYGGRIIYQQTGHEPLDAYKSFLKELEMAGDFKINRAEWIPEFWRYFTDNSLHTFVDTESENGAKAFSTPPWEDKTHN